MSRFFKATFSINIAEHLPHDYKVGFDRDNGQEFIVGLADRFFDVVQSLKNHGVHEFDQINFCHWHDGGDDATLEMFYQWESGLKAYAHRARFVGGYYHVNGEPFNTLYHACEYAKQCDSEISDDTAELNHIVDQTFREYCESQKEKEFLVHGNDLFDL